MLTLGYRALPHVEGVTRRDVDADGVRLATHRPSSYVPPHAAHLLRRERYGGWRDLVDGPREEPVIDVVHKAVFAFATGAVANRLIAAAADSSVRRMALGAPFRDRAWLAVAVRLVTARENSGPRWGSESRMASQVIPKPRAVADKAREVLAKVRPGPLTARRSLPIRAGADEIRRLWADADGRAAVLAGIPAADASFEFAEELRDWGTVVTVELRLEAAVPGMTAQTLAGKLVRRLKALAETGEVPTTAANPAARNDAGEPAA
jgi:hypothetical protein